ncbi:acyl-CoA dehydrogenase [Phenylobacterium sp. LjRoot219]|uniref:acyl-CoA dehydrogenase family protein n=1 Tax=Phenylobacterium sp. LjRoot219 TaxID=3342283 RepID=UPI003ECD04D2
MPDDLMARKAGPALLTFTPEETEIMNAAGSLASELLPLARLHGPDALDLTSAARDALGELGWFGLALAENLGGSGLSAVEQAVFFREMGRQCAPVDILTQSLAAQVATDDALRGAILAGREPVALAVAEAAGVRLIGAPAARLALLADSAQATLFDIGEAPTETRSGLDPATTLRVAGRLDKVVAQRETEEVWDLGQLGAAAMLVGIAEAALDLTVEYAKVRETFGKKIGAYQAVRHPCADMAVRVEAARSQLWFAAAALKGARSDARAHLMAAKHLANEAALANADVSIQLHGGIGVTDEHNAHLLLKRSLLLGRLFGAKRSLLEQLLHAKLAD